MVQIVILSANGEKRTMKTLAFTAGAATGESVAKALRKKKSADLIATYNHQEQVLTAWGWKEGKAGSENKHELPPMADGTDAPLLFGDVVITASSSDFTEDQYSAFYEEAFGGFEDLDSEDEEEDEDDIEEEEEDEEQEEDDGEDGDAEEEEEEEEEEDEDDDCYDDGDENGGGSKRRAPRRRAVASPEYRRIDMGLRSRVKLPVPVGKRAPRWQTAAELAEENYD